MNVQKAKDLIDGISDLPTLPFVVSKMLEVVGDSRSAARDLGQVISMDQTLTAKVLRLGNSSFYGFRGQISTISHAVVMLGFNVIKSLALGLSVVKIMGNMKKNKECRMIGKIIEEMTPEYEGKAVIGKVDVDNNPGISAKFGIRNIPTVLFFKNGAMVDKQVGVVPKKALVDKLEALL